MKEQQVVYLVLRVDDLAVPHVPSNKVTCSRCGRTCWADVQALQRLCECEVTFVCNRCQMAAFVKAALN